MSKGHKSILLLENSGPSLSNSGKSSQKGDNIDELRTESSISFLWTERFHCRGVQESKSQCLCPVFIGSGDEGGGDSVFAHVSQPSASCFAVVLL